LKSTERQNRRKRAQPKAVSVKMMKSGKNPHPENHRDAAPNVVFGIKSRPPASAKLRFRLRLGKQLYSFFCGSDLGSDLPNKERRGPQALADPVKSEIAKWTPIIKAAGVKAE